MHFGIGSGVFLCAWTCVCDTIYFFGFASEIVGRLWVVCTLQLRMDLLLTIMSTSLAACTTVAGFLGELTIMLAVCQSICADLKLDPIVQRGHMNVYGWPWPDYAIVHDRYEPAQRLREPPFGLQVGDGGLARYGHGTLYDGHCTYQVRQVVILHLPCETRGRRAQPLVLACLR